MIETVAINYVAVLLSAVAAFIIGMIWYSPFLFGRTWATGHGITEEQMKEMASVNSAHLIAFLSYLVTAAVLDMVLKSLNVITLPMALRVGFLLWLGFSAAISLMNAMYQQKSLHVYLIDVGYTLAYILVMAAILTLWR